MGSTFQFAIEADKVIISILTLLDEIENKLELITFNGTGQSQRLLEQLRAIALMKRLLVENCLISLKIAV